MSSRELWVPGAAGPSLEDFVARLRTAIEDFAARRDIAAPTVEVELADGSTYVLHQIRPEPGYGFVTICPHPEKEEVRWVGECTPEEIIVPVGAIRRITLGAEEERRAEFGFAVPETAPE